MINLPNSVLRIFVSVARVVGRRSERFSFSRTHQAELAESMRVSLVRDRRNSGRQAVC
jgi:hypothetical protein